MYLGTPYACSIRSAHPGLDRSTVTSLVLEQCQGDHPAPPGEPGPQRSPSNRRSTGRVDSLRRVYFVANELFLSEQVDRDRLLSLGLWAGAAVIAKILCKAFANAVSHTAAYRILADLRLALAERLSRMPLGRVQVRSSGHLRKVLQDDVEQLELGLSHAIPDIAAAIAVPLASLIVMFVISWPVASAALAVVLLSVVLVAWGSLVQLASPRASRGSRSTSIRRSSRSCAA